VTSLARQVERTPAEVDAIDVPLAVSGDTHAFERLYRRHAPKVNSLARWLLSRDDVDDVLQDVFIRVWEKLATFRGQSAFGTWLHRLATNVILRDRERYRRDQSKGFGAEHEEIARALKITVGTSRSQLHHARMALRAFLAVQGDGR
jgi:DNA-directed RNA polymerase specialized sigma24 family protein